MKEPIKPFQVFLGTALFSYSLPFILLFSHPSIFSITLLLVGLLSALKGFRNNQSTLLLALFSFLFGLFLYWQRLSGITDIFLIVALLLLYLG